MSVLRTTARYLVKEVFAKECVKDGGSSNIAKAYVFVEDRLRAVRQDLTVQGLAVALAAAEVLKTAANFYVVAGYLMCDEV